MADLTPAQQNLIMRQLLLQSSPKMLKKVGTFSSTNLGDSIRAKLFNVGIITRVWAKGTLTYNTSATPPTNISPFGAQKAIRKIRLTDFDSSDRINISPELLSLRNSLRRNIAPFEEYPVVGLNNVADTDYSPGKIRSTPVITASQNGLTVDFWVEIPVAYDPDAGDLRGMLLAQSAVGELFVVFDLASSISSNTVGDDVLFSGGTTGATFVSVSFDVYQEFLIPQADQSGVVPLPALDILTVYEIIGFQSTDNIALNQEKLVSFPNARAVQGVYWTYLNNLFFGGTTGGVSAANDLAIVRLIANGNNVLREYFGVDQLYRENAIANKAFVPKAGTYFWDFRMTPIRTNLFGNIQAGFTPQGTIVTPRFDVAYESLYLKGAALSGLSQSG